MNPGIATSERIAYIEGARDAVEAFEIRLSMGDHPRLACEEGRLWIADLVGWMLQDYADDPPPHPRINRTKLFHKPEGSKLIHRRNPDQEQDVDLPDVSDVDRGSTRGQDVELDLDSDPPPIPSPRKPEGEADDFGGLDFI